MTREQALLEMATIKDEMAELWKDLQPLREQIAPLEAKWNKLYIRRFELDRTTFPITLCPPVNGPSKPKTQLVDSMNATIKALTRMSAHERRELIAALR